MIGPPKSRRLDTPIAVSLEDLAPRDNFYRHLEAGLIWGRELYFDATRVRADADTDSLVPRFYADATAHVADVFAVSQGPTDAPEVTAEDGPLHFPVNTGDADAASEGSVAYRLKLLADAATCNACPLKPKCTESSRGRIIHRSLHADYLEKVRGYHETEAYKKAMRKRQVWVEPLFAEAKLWHGLRRFRRRGLEKVNIEGLLIAAGQHLKRFLSRDGVGTTTGPCGSLVALPTGLQ